MFFVSFSRLFSIFSAQNVPEHCSSFAAKGDTLTVHYTVR